MPTSRRYIRAPHRARLSGAQEMHLWLGAGPRDEPAPFPSDEARRAAWLLHGPRLRGVLPMASGRRAQAWWDYEAPIAWPGYDRERGALYAAGLLGVEEKAALEAEWHHDFERGCDPDFALSLGPGEYLTGAAARRAHYRWADIPRPLVRKWTAEHKRAAQRIRQLEAGSFCPGDAGKEKPAAGSDHGL